MKSTLLTGPRHTRLERRAFRLSDKNASDTLGSILYVVRNDARRSHVEDRWAKSYRPLRLRVETLDAVVRDLYEDLEGPFQELSGPLNRRLTEFALDETTAGTRGALAGEPASASLADAFSSRFSLFADAGIATPDSLADEFDGSALDDRIASATVDAYRQYRRLLEDHVDDWVCTRGHLFDSVATSEQPVTERFPELEVVIFSGYHEFRPLERDVVERIAAAYPTIAILPLHQGGHTGVDTVTTDALAVYESLGFEREAIPPRSRPAGEDRSGNRRPVSAESRRSSGSGRAPVARAPDAGTGDSLRGPRTQNRAGGGA